MLRTGGVIYAPEPTQAPWPGPDQAPDCSHQAPVMDPYLGAMGHGSPVTLEDDMSPTREWGGGGGLEHLHLLPPPMAASPDRLMITSRRLRKPGGGGLFLSPLLLVLVFLSSPSPTPVSTHTLSPPPAPTPTPTFMLERICECVLWIRCRQHEA